MKMWYRVEDIGRGEFLLCDSGAYFSVSEDLVNMEARFIDGTIDIVKDIVTDKDENVTHMLLFRNTDIEKDILAYACEKDRVIFQKICELVGKFQELEKHGDFINLPDYLLKGEISIDGLLCKLHEHNNRAAERFADEYEEMDDEVRKIITERTSMLEVIGKPSVEFHEYAVRYLYDVMEAYISNHPLVASNGYQVMDKAGTVLTYETLLNEISGDDAAFYYICFSALKKVKYWMRRKHESNQSNIFGPKIQVQASWNFEGDKSLYRGVFWKLFEDTYEVVETEYKKGQIYINKCNFRIPTNKKMDSVVDFFLEYRDIMCMETAVVSFSFDLIEHLKTEGVIQ